MATPTPPATVDILQVHQILEGARRRGLDLAPLVRRVGIAPALLAAPRARVTQAQYAALMLLLRRLLRDELWGLCSQPVPMGSFVWCCRLLVHTATLGDALRTGLGYFHRLLADFTPRLQVEAGMAHVRLVSRRPRDPGLGYADRCFCFLCYGLASWLVARRIPVSEVTYRPIDRGLSSDATRLFQAPVSYHADAVGFRFDARWLQLPVVQNTQSLNEFLRAAPAGLLVRYRDQARLSERVRRLLRRQGPAQMPTLEQVARQLALTPQTLRRRLAREGLSFQGLKDDLRRDAAIGDLADPRLTLADIAVRVGFADVSTFHRAFKAWTGLAPGAYRQARLVPAAALPG